MNAHHSEIPSNWVQRFASVIPEQGRVLDLACGYGRNARFLASKGYVVEAVDRDPDALASIAGLERINTRQLDIEGGSWPFHAEVFDAVVVTHYLYRPLLPALFKLIAPQGVLIYETFMVGNERFGKPSSPAFLLRPGELLDLVKGRMAVVAFEQGEVNQPRQAMIQRLCAVRASGNCLTLPEQIGYS
jgi:SAM-dependent methyltransferase